MEKSAETHPTSCNFLDFNKMSKVKKVLDEAKEQNNPEIDLVDKGINTFGEMPGLLIMQNITRLTLSHNKISVIPPGIANLPNLESLNLFNNHIEVIARQLPTLPNDVHALLLDIPTSLSSMAKLKILNLGMNRLSTLPRGFGAFPQLEVLDLTYNNLNEKNLPGNFFMIVQKQRHLFIESQFNPANAIYKTLLRIDADLTLTNSLQSTVGTIPESLRALYLGDNDFEYIPPEVGQLKNLQILVLRENDLVCLPKEVGELSRLRELHIQGNRLTFLPPELGNLDLLGQHCVVRMDNNPWVPPIADQLLLGVTHVIEYIRSDTYKYLYSRQQHGRSPPPKRNDKSKKISRKRDHN